ncbi:MAG: glycosyltransferase family 39 protein [Acidobacteriota bacterium]
MSRTTLALTGILLLAAGLRLWGVFHDLPFSYYGDELHFMKRSMAMGTGDLNPHWFHKPALPMYLWLLAYGLFYAAGRLVGRFGSTEEFGAYFLTTPGPFLLIGRLVVLAFGVATVWVVYLLARRAFASERAGLAAALVAAVLAPMVASSQTMKSDVQGGFFIALSLLVYLRTRDDPGWRPFLLAALLAGVAMGAHYYGLVLVPAYGLMELWNGASHRLPWRTALLRAALVPGLFAAGFFLTSPYNLLDPTWMRENVRQLKHTFRPEPDQVLFEPDSRVEFQPGTPEALGGASASFVDVLTAQKGFGLPLTALAVLGFGAALASRETRWYAALVAVPILIYFFAAITVAAFHVQPRHLNAVYPILTTLTWPGALLLGRRKGVAAALVGLACIPTLVEAAETNREITRQDSRTVSYEWIVRNLPRDSRVLLDDYGPALPPDPRSAARQQALLRSLPPSPFTRAQGRRLDLLRRYPSPDAFDLVELGHPWWLPREKSDAELRGNPVDLDMGNPLVNRQPESVEEYRRDGIRFVVTNSDARRRYFEGGEGAGFPSFVHFYRGLEKERLVRAFDPADWGGKGPIVRIYELGESE